MAKIGSGCWSIWGSKVFCRLLTLEIRPAIMIQPPSETGILPVHLENSRIPALTPEGASFQDGFEDSISIAITGIRFRVASSRFFVSNFVDGIFESLRLVLLSDFGIRVQFFHFA